MEKTKYKIIRACGSGKLKIKISIVQLTTRIIMQCYNKNVIKKSFIKFIYHNNYIYKKHFIYILSHNNPHQTSDFCIAPLSVLMGAQTFALHPCQSWGGRKLLHCTLVSPEGGANFCNEFAHTEFVFMCSFRTHKYKQYLIIFNI